MREISMAFIPVTAAMCLFAIVGLGDSNAITAEPQDSPPAAQPRAFEVASIKIAFDPGRVPMFCIIPCMPGERLSVTGSRVEIRFMSLHKLIVTACRIKPFQLSGPDWMRSQRFDIIAKIPEGVSKDRVPEMLQGLLAERFKLSIHRETQDLPVYALVPGKNGVKLREAAADADAPIPVRPGDRSLYSGQGDARMLENGSLVVTGGSLGPIRVVHRSPGFRFEFPKLTMPGLAELLAPHKDRPVIDMTNLKGAYYFEWEDRPDWQGAAGRGGRDIGGPPEGGRKGGNGPEAGPPRDPIREGLFLALEKAGLKLESRKAPVETIVVDHLEKAPTEN